MKTYFKKILATAVVCVLLGTSHAVQADTKACVVLTKNIISISSASIKDRDIVKDILLKDGFIIGSKSQDITKAVREFQKKNNLQVVGSIGPKTRMKLNEIATKQCSDRVAQIDTVATTSTTTVATTVSIPDIDPPKVEVVNPNGGGTVEQGYGREVSIMWTSKNISADDMVLVELLSENMDLVAKTWKVKNTGKLVLNFDEVDDLPVGWFYMRVRYMCNSQAIACAEDVSDSTFVVYPPTGYFANFFHFNNFKSGEKYDVSGSQPVSVQWYPYTKDFDYYRMYLGNVVLDKEVLVINTASIGQAVREADVKSLKKDMKKTDREIQNAYYVRVQAMKRSRGDVPDVVLKEITTGQFGIR